MNRQPLREDDLGADPIAAAVRWWDEARALDMALPEAMALATVSSNGEPSCRFVLCRGFDTRGITFFTNYQSDKAQDLAAHPQAAVAFHWEPLHRQLRVSGGVERIAEAESAAYFQTRGRGSRISAWASAQSQPIASHHELQKSWDEISTQFDDAKEVPLPPFWGGYRMRWESVEFWQGQADRLHDRIRYRLNGGGWVRERLQP